MLLVLAFPPLCCFRRFSSLLRLATKVLKESGVLGTRDVGSGMETGPIWAVFFVGDVSVVVVVDSTTSLSCPFLLLGEAGIVLVLVFVSGI